MLRIIPHSSCSLPNNQAWPRLQLMETDQNGLVHGRASDRAASFGVAPGDTSSSPTNRMTIRLSPSVHSGEAFRAAAFRSASSSLLTRSVCHLPLDFIVLLSGQNLTLGTRSRGP